MTTFIDFEPNWAKNEQLRPRLEEQLKQQMLEEVPKMVSRLGELESLITHEVGQYADFMVEAQHAFQFGLWRAVVALIGIAGESFTNSLYNQINTVTSASGEQLAKDRIFGRDENLPEKRKLDILRLVGLISPGNHDKLLKIKKLRDRYVHGMVQGRDIGKDARNAFRLFRQVLKERFDAKYTIRDGKIVARLPQA